MIACMDFETYSPAGYIFNHKTNKYECLPGANKKGLSVVGAARYTEHPETEILCLAYNLGSGAKLWKPGDSHPLDLFEHLEKGSLIEAWNVAFEAWVWDNIAVTKYKFPFLPPLSLRCAAAKSRAFSYPGSLEKAGEVANIEKQKFKEGKLLIKKYCVPRNPTKNNPLHRTQPEQDLYEYCLRDIEAEAQLSKIIPDLPEIEQKLWHVDHAINTRGVCIDLELINKCIKLLETAYAKYNKELELLTCGAVKSASKLPDLKKWLKIDTLRAQDITELLKQDLPKHVKRVLQIRENIGSAAVKKLYSMSNSVCKDDRLHDLFIYHSAHTGRAAGTGPQPQNLPNSGPAVKKCSACGKHSGVHLNACLWCTQESELQEVEWNTEAIDNAIEILNCENLELVELFFNDCVATISGCLRSMFIAAPGHDLLCSDYSAIEAVVLAALAREEWRLEVFRTHGKIYEMSASKISGVPFSEFERHKEEYGTHHPFRKTIGKVAELASGYQGWIGAWKAFGADKFYSDEEIKKAILKWRSESPNIVKFWHEIEQAAINAVSTPSIEYSYNDIKFLCTNDVLYCKLLSGRTLKYHKPLLSHDKKLTFEGWNSNPLQGKTGWIRKNTYGGRLTENIVQATARDILAHALINLEEKGYPVVLHIHDEIVCEVPKNKKSLKEFERIMSTMPKWAKDWPIKATGGWRAKKYSK